MSETRAADRIVFPPTLYQTWIETVGLELSCTETTLSPLESVRSRIFSGATFTCASAEAQNIAIKRNGVIFRIVIFRKLVPINTYLRELGFWMSKTHIGITASKALNVRRKLARANCPGSETKPKSRNAAT
jgi:hypothetical protein